MVDKRRCKDCEYCKAYGWVAPKTKGACGKRKYFCEHPDTPPIYGFIGYGLNTRESPLKMKTHPKWCPLIKE